MKVALGILLLCFSTIIGYFLAGKYLDRKNFYSDFLSFNQLFKQEVIFNKTTLVSIIKKKDKKSDFYSILREVFINGKIDYDLKYLTKDDNALFYSYVTNLGASDIDTQIDFINKTGEILNVKFNQSLEEEKRYKTLYIKMGFLIGLTLMIIVL